MFEAKYSRLKFWIISIILLIPSAVLSGIAKFVERSGGAGDGALWFYSVIIILQLIWLNTLANRIRDYGNNPWNALLALIPLVNLGLALYYGIAKHKKDNSITTNYKEEGKSSLAKAVINHSKDIVSDIKPHVSEYIEKHSSIQCSEDDINNSLNNNIQKLSEDEIYEQIMLEIEENRKIKSTWAKAFSKVDGDENKANALYINLRVETITTSENKRVDNILRQEEEQKKAKQEYRNTQDKENHDIKLNTRTNQDLLIQKYYEDGKFTKYYAQQFKEDGYKAWNNVTLISSKFFSGTYYLTEIDYDNDNFLVMSTDKKIINRYRFNRKDITKQSIQ